MIYDAEELEERTIDYSIGLNSGLVETPTWSAIPVTEQTALGLTSLFCGCRVICEDIASLPLELLKVDDEGHATKAKDNPLYHMLGSEPNVEMTKTSFWETMVLSMIIYGNAIAEIQRNGAGEPIGFWPVHPHYVRIYRSPDDGTLRYHDTRNTYGGPPGFGMVDCPAEDVLHIPGLSLQGAVGMSLLYVARQTLGWGLGAQRFGASLWRNVAKPKGIITETVAKQTSDNAVANMKRSWQQEHSKEEVGGTAFLKYGYGYTPLALDNNEQIQFTELLQFYNSEIGRLLRLNPTKLMDMGRATWGNLTEVNRDHWGTSIKPWAVKIEEECERKLLKPSEKGQYKIRFNTEDLLRADMLTRYQAYSVGLAGEAFLDVPGVRQMENLPPMDDKPEETQETDTTNQPPEQNVQDTALNGTQITSLLLITDKVRTGDYSPEAGSALIAACFPNMSTAEINSIIAPLAKQSMAEPKEEPQKVPPEAPPAEAPQAEAPTEAPSEEETKDGN